MSKEEANFATPSPSHGLSDKEIPVQTLVAQEIPTQNLPLRGLSVGELQNQEFPGQDLSQSFPSATLGGSNQGSTSQLSLPDFVEDFLSPEYELPPHAFPSGSVAFPSQSISLAEAEHLSAFPSSATNRSLENILLEGAGMDESIDLGASSYLDATDDVTSDVELKDEMDQGLDSTLVEDSESRINSEPPSNAMLITVGSSDVLEPQVGAISLEDSKAPLEISSGNILNVTGESFQALQESSNRLADNSNSNLVGVNDSETQLFSGGAMLGDSSTDIRANDTSSTVKFEITDGSEDVDKVSESVHSMKVVTEEVVDVGFVVAEEKGDPSMEESVSSTIPNSRSLMTLFAAADSAGGTDVEGKNFFDSFSTGVEEPVDQQAAGLPSTSPRGSGPPFGPPFGVPIGGMVTGHPAGGMQEADAFGTVEQVGNYGATGQVNSFGAAGQMDSFGNSQIVPSQGADMFGTIGQSANLTDAVAPVFITNTTPALNSFQPPAAHPIDSFNPMAQVPGTVPPGTSHVGSQGYGTQISAATSPHTQVSAAQGIIPGVPSQSPLTSPPVVYHEPKLDFGWQTPSSAAASDGVDGISSVAASVEDENRRYDAWIPSDTTARVIAQSLGQETSGTGSNVALSPAQLCRPGVVSADLLGDPIYDLVIRTMGEQEANKRLVLNADSVPQDDVGLRQLIKSDCLRSAVDLTGRLLTVHCGQGPGKMSQPSQHTPYSLQLWYTRLALMVKLRLFSQAEIELEAFGNLDTPDLFYEYQQEHFPLRRGSMVPFGLRLLHGEMPHLCGRAQESFDRLYHLLAVIDRILLNLSRGLSEDGRGELNESSVKLSVSLWKSRRNQVLYSVGSCLLSVKDYSAAIEVYGQLLKDDEKNKCHLYSGLGRIHLQMGDITTARGHFEASEALMDDSLSSTKCQKAVNKGLISLCGNQFSEAFQHFHEATNIDPTNTTAVNNMSVCQLYLGRLGQALQALETLIYSDPLRHLQESSVLNLCTLYELESSKALQKKQRLLSLISQHKGNGFNIACLKMS